jgi:cephalosporin-C deacetylase-like acetyl esterase
MMRGAVTMRFRWLLLVLAMALPASALCAPLTWEQLRAPYDYDTTRPLDAKADEPVDRGTVWVQDVHFTSLDDQRVPLTIWRPRQCGAADKPPVILFLHGLGGERSHAGMIVANLVAPLGIAVCAIDAPLHGERKLEGQNLFSADLAQTAQSFRQGVVDNRRALDYLATRGDLDMTRVYLEGTSMGAIMGTLVAAVDERIRAAFLVVGGGNLRELFMQSQHSSARRLREALTALPETAGGLETFDPAGFAGHISPRPVWMLNGRDDKIIPPVCAEALHSAAQEPKRVTWYSGGSGDGHLPPLGVYYLELMQFLQAQGLTEATPGR